MKFDGATLILLGVIAFMLALAGEVYRRAQLNAWSVQQAAFQDEVDLISTAIKTGLRHPESCSRMLAGLPFVPDGKTPVMLNYTYDMEGPLTKDSDVTVGIGIADLDIEHFTEQGDMRTEIADYPGQKLVRWPARLNLSLEPRHLSKAQSRWAGAHKIDLHFPFYAWVDGFGKILSCFGRDSAAALCNSLGGYYLVDFEDPPEGNERCRQSVHTEAFVSGTWIPRGSCRYLGRAARAEDCADRYGQASTAHRLQDGGFKFAQETHQCLVCE